VELAVHRFATIPSVSVQVARHATLAPSGSLSVRRKSIRSMQRALVRNAAISSQISFARASVVAVGLTATVHLSASRIEG
jgi:hypothetical protein